MSEHAVESTVFTHTRAKSGLRWQHRLSAAWRVCVASSIVLIGSAAAYPFLPRHFEATADLLIRATNTDGETTWNQSGANAIDDNVIQTKLDIVRSEPLQAGLVAQFGLMDDPEFNPALQPSWLRRSIERVPILSDYLPPPKSDEQQVVSILQQHLVARRQSKSYLIQIGYWSRDPVKAAQLTNAVAASFLKDEMGRRQESHEQLLASLRSRVTSLEMMYQADEKAEDDFAQAAGIADPGEREALQQQLNSLSTAVADAYRHTIESRNHAVMLAGQTDPENTREALDSSLLQHLRERYVELRSGTGTATGAAAPGTTNLTIDLLRQGIAAETQHLVMAAQNDAAIAQKSEASLRAEAERVSAVLADWNRKQRHREDLHRAVQNDLDALAAAHERYTREAGRGDALQADITIVAMGMTPDRPIFPTPLLYGAGTLGVIILLDGLILLPPIIRREQARSALGVL